MMACVNSDREAESMASYIRNATFKTTRFAAGYDEAEVDAFLDAAIELIRRGERVSMAPQFTETRLRPGYVKQEVDELIVEIMRRTPPFR